MAEESGDARSAAGHAAMPMGGVGDRWVLIQVNTFTNWVNEHLAEHQKIRDLQSDLSDGTRLCALMENLQKRKIGRVVAKPVNQHQSLENVTMAIRAMLKDNIKLVNIGSEDIVNGNLKLILGMIWQLILRYQIGKATKAPPKKLMLAWLRAVIPELKIANFSTDWNDGTALHALIEYCRPGSCPDWRSLNRSDKVANCENGMSLAKRLFDIPMVVSPADMASPDLDELSGMTYLSYFMKLDSPGYHATLRWVKSRLSDTMINNFQTDWNDGKVLSTLVADLGGSIPGWPQLDNSDWLGNISTAASVAETQLGVSPVIAPREMIDRDVEHLGIMAYAARFQQLQPSTPIPPQRLAHTEVENVRLTPEVRIPPPRPVQLQSFPGQVTPRRGEPVTFNVDLLDDDLDRSRVHVEVDGPTTQPEVTLGWSGSSAQGEFVPLETGRHEIRVYSNGILVDGGPIDVNIKRDASSVRLVRSHDSRMALQQSQPFLVDGAGVPASGAVSVETKAPSGRIGDLGVVEASGVYTANFSPSEVGDWQISIFYEGKPIQGSPFDVRVYDPAQVRVFGLEGAAVGRNFSFSADCSQAGEGALTVELHRGSRLIPATIQEESPKVYKVGFTPDGPGIYNIKVLFAGMEITGSPYTLEIVDSSNVTATGDGLASVEVNRRAQFIVKTGGGPGGWDDVKVNVTAPRGQKIPAQVHSAGDGTFRVEYTPTEIGEYVVDVFYFGKPISGSPFRVNGFDWNQIRISSLPPAVSIGKAVEFNIDAVQAGSGNLEIMVNDGSIPCSVQNRGNRQFHATFMPREVGPHYVQMKFNQQEVPGSPWKVDVGPPAQFTANGPGLGMVSVRQNAVFDVTRQGGLGAPDGSIAVNVTAPSRRQVPVRVHNNFNGSHGVDYVPTEVGNHQIEILSAEGLPVAGSPYTSKAYDTSAIQIGKVEAALVGRTAEFTIDVGRAGEGQLEIMVNRGAVPNTVKTLRKGLFAVGFVPREAGDHVVDVRFNDVPLPDCPIAVPVADVSRVTAQGEGLTSVAVNRQSCFRVNAGSAVAAAELAVRVTAPSGERVPAKIVQQLDGDFKVEYSSKYTGRHRVEILYAGQAIVGSPFFVEIYDPNKIRIEGPTAGSLNEPIVFDVVRNEAGKAELGVVVVSPSGQHVPFKVASTPVGKRVTYVPTEAGAHNIFLTYGGLDVPGSPRTQMIQLLSSPDLVTASGEGLVRGSINQPQSFIVDPKGQPGEIYVQADGPNSIARCTIEPEGDGRYQVKYTPSEAGIFKVTVNWNGSPISGSPFLPRVVAPGRVRPVGGWQSLLDASSTMKLLLNQQKRIELEHRNSGPGKVKAEVIGPQGGVPVAVQSLGDELSLVTFTPTAAGEYFLKVWWLDLPIAHFPIRGAVVGPEKVVLTGQGLSHARVAEEAEFYVDGTNAGKGSPNIRLTGVKSELQVHVAPDGPARYRCTYTPQSPGAYLLDIMWAERQVDGSPFKVNVPAYGNARKVVCTGDGLRTGVYGKDIKSVIDTHLAGPGELTAQCSGPHKVAYCELFDHRDGSFTLNVRPQETGRHVLQVKYGEEHVPGSPFVLRVAGAPDASKVHVSGPGIENGILPVYESRFIVETRGAGAGQLTVRIRGPKGAFRVEMQRESQKDRTILCRYDPTEVGDYIIHVKWSGEHVPGSPFRVQIFDTQEELEQHLARYPDVRSAPLRGHSLAAGNPLSEHSWPGEY